MSIQIGIDVGGTFTDFLVIYPDGTRRIHKTSSVPANPPLAVRNGLEEIAKADGLSVKEFISRLGLIVHGTTVTTNALLTRSGPVTGLLTTEGFRDVLPMRNGTREEAYDNRLKRPQELVPRYLRFPVGERVDYRGKVVTPLKAEDVREAANVFREQKVASVAISFIHSHARPDHELEAATIVRELLPNAYVTTSSELLRQARFYQRTSTTVLNAYAGPIISSYLDTLTRQFDELQFSGVLLLMQSNGGVATPQELAKRAALSLLSGPASGPTAGLLVTDAHGWHSCLTVDMGGTSFDAAVVKDGRPLVMTDGIIDRWSIALPMVDIHTIGAGGGSIACVDKGGLLRVGPQSAGAVPGPACYGRGGVNATVTDADVILGYIDPTTFLHGGMHLDIEAARQAIRRDVAEPLGISIEQAAAGIYQMVNVNMATGVRDITVRRGLDPREFPIVVAGGAGPVHAAAIAHELEIPLLVVPRDSSIFCAAGMLICDFKHDYVQSVNERLDTLDRTRLVATWQTMTEAGAATLRNEGVPTEHLSFLPALDARYKGQWYELTLELDSTHLTDPDPAAIARIFHALHDRLFGYSSPEMAVEILNVRLTALGRTPNRRVDLSGALGGAHSEPVRQRRIWSVIQNCVVTANVYAGATLRPGDEVEGPAIIELGTTTIVVHDDYNAIVDMNGSFVLYLREKKNEIVPKLALAQLA